jgi:hypothetical protein
MIVSIPLSNANNSNHITNTGQLDEKVIHLTGENANANSYCNINYTEPTSQTNNATITSTAVNFNASSQNLNQNILVPVIKQTNNTSTNSLLVFIYFF